MEEKSVNRKRAKKHAQLKEFWRRYKKNKAAVVGLVLLCIIVGMAVFADLVRLQRGLPDLLLLACLCLQRLSAGCEPLQPAGRGKLQEEHVCAAVIIFCIYFFSINFKMCHLLKRSMISHRSEERRVGKECRL